MGGGARREESSVREERKKEEEGGGGRSSPKDVSLVGALLCYKGTSDIGALLSTWHDTPGPGGSIGRHCPCLTTEHLGHQDGWRPMFECRYKNCFLGDIFVNFF
jgi:hypothetical protein